MKKKTLQYIDKGINYHIELPKSRREQDEMEAPDIKPDKKMWNGKKGKEQKKALKSKRMDDFG